MVAIGGGVGAGYRVMNECSHNERQSLLHFKASLEDPDGLLSTWGGEEDDCCKWSGVTCNYQTGHVTKLEFDSLLSEGVRGEINPSLLNLTYLNHLDLSDNQFYGTIPTFIGSMTRLRYLKLSGNNFTGTILNSIGALTNLRCLDIADNNFIGTIPNSIGSLTELRLLDLSWNNFNGTIPKSIGSLTELRTLDLSSNSFHGIIPTTLRNLTKLEELSLRTLVGCRIENIDWLSHLSRLTSIDMSQISLAHANHWVNAILSLQSLSFLTLSDCDLSQVMVPYSSSYLNSSSFSSINTLQLENNNLNSSMHSWLFPLTSNDLYHLHLGSNKLDGIPKYLGNLCGLTSLILVNNSAVVNLPNFLKNLSSGCTAVTLRWLDVSSSQFTGSLSDEIQMFSSLETLDLSHNQLSGTVSEKVWELPQIESLDVSSNLFGGVMSDNIQKSNLSYIDLSSCKLSHFPKLIQRLKNAIRIDISNNRISDTIPVEFWNTWSSQLTYLNLSSNNLTGRATDLLSNFDLDHSVIDLSSNNFNGPIVNVSSTLTLLNLSRNKFSGGLSFLCQIVDKLLFLDLSHNSFTGQLPDCLWQFKELIVLNLGDNNLYGRLPTSLGYLVQLQVLYLYNNSFSGEMPLSIMNCTHLNFLNFGANKFCGNVPVWIGENLSQLYVLSLRSNNFSGIIPLQLCRLVHLQVLDLSMNNLFGTIPTCLNNLTLLVQGLSQNTHYLRDSRNNSPLGTPAIGTLYSDRFSDIYVDHAMIEWHGIEREFIGILRFLKSIDISSNNLTGKIPKELTDLHELLALNLSKNALLGEIPQNIGKMKKLLNLDLSRNKLSGGLPSSMSEMTSLDYLDVSYNNLSGRIPSSTQLQSFEPSRYTGNVRLCGPPISKYCPGDKDSDPPPIISDDEGKDELDRLFYIGMAIGFAIGFWLACGVLLLNRHGRHFFFHFLDSSKDFIYVKVMVFISKWQRFAHTS